MQGFVDGHNVAGVHKGLEDLPQLALQLLNVDVEPGRLPMLVAAGLGLVKVEFSLCFSYKVSKQEDEQREKASDRQDSSGWGSPAGTRRSTSLGSGNVGRERPWQALIPLTKNLRGSFRLLFENLQSLLVRRALPLR